MKARLLLIPVVVLMAPRWIQWSVYGEGGEMQHLVPAGCDDASGRTPFGGAGATFEAQTESSGELEHRLSFKASADFRFGVVHEDGSRRNVTLGRATALIGWDSRFITLRAGLYVGNVQEEERQLVAPAFSIRGGSRRGFVRVSFLDQPQCFPADCVFGVEGGTDTFTVGTSVGLTTVRVFATGRFPNVLGPLDLHVGAFLSPESRDSDGTSGTFYVGIGDSL